VYFCAGDGGTTTTTSAFHCVKLDIKTWLGPGGSFTARKPSVRARSGESLSEALRQR